MSKKNSTTKNRNHRQGRPAGYVPPRLAAIARQVDAGDYRADSMEAAVNFVDLTQVRGGLYGQKKLLGLPLYRMTRGAFREATHEDLSLEGVRAFRVSELPARAGVVLWNDEPGAPVVGLSWNVIDDTHLEVELFSGTGDDLRNGRHTLLAPEDPHMPLSMALHLPVMEGAQYDFYFGLGSVALSVLRHLCANREASGIISCGDRVSTTGEKVPFVSTTASRFEVRSVAEAKAERDSAPRQGSSPSFSFWRRGTSYTTKRGTRVERRGTWCCTDKPTRQPRERIVGTTIHAAA